MRCRNCFSESIQIFADLETAPPSNAYLQKNQLLNSEIWIPLKVGVCQNCWLCQTQDFVSATDVFTNDYAYFSSVSTSWLEHSKNYANSVSLRLSLNAKSLVTEVASNDGYLLQYFKEKLIPCLGIEPTKSTADAAIKKGITTLQVFLGEESATRIVEKYGKSDLVIGNNVLAHVPDINDFIAGMVTLLKTDGVITLEFPHLVELLDKNQFDTIYHEHFSYLSLTTLKSILANHKLCLFDVEKIPTHGGSLRAWIQHAQTGKQRESDAVQHLLAEEKIFGVQNIDTYKSFQTKITSIKYDLINFLIGAQRKNQKVIAYGAAAKGNTLINFSGVRKDLIPFVIDLSPAKVSKYCPGSHIPIVSFDEIINLKPNYIVILPWNLKKEITESLEFARSWGCKFVTAIPNLEIF